MAQAVLTQQPGTAGGQSATTEARFTDVRVERYTARGDDGDTHDEFTLGYAQVTFSVRPQPGDGAPADAISTTQPAAVFGDLSPADTHPGQRRNLAAARSATPSPLSSFTPAGEKSLRGVLHRGPTALR